MILSFSAPTPNAENKEDRATKVPCLLCFQKALIFVGGGVAKEDRANALSS